MNDEEKPLSGLRKMLDEADAKNRADAERFKALDQDVCQLCDAKGEDKRSLFIDCMYDVQEVVPDAINLHYVDTFVKHQQGYYMRLCKTCRGRLLEHMRVWAEECKQMRGLPKDSDGLPEYNDPERNIPMRINGTVVMMTRAEYDAYIAKRDSKGL
jgi:hypothetical protein